jgi:hypothetical protein
MYTYWNLLITPDFSSLYQNSYVLDEVICRTYIQNFGRFEELDLLSGYRTRVSTIMYRTCDPTGCTAAGDTLRKDDRSPRDETAFELPSCERPRDTVS